MQGHEITTGALAKLLDITPKTIADLGKGKREIIVRARSAHMAVRRLDHRVCEAPARRSGRP